jgi:hypothetical protein
MVFIASYTHERAGLLRESPDSLLSPGAPTLGAGP